MNVEFAENEIHKLKEDFEALENKFNVLEHSYLAQLKKAFLNPYYCRIAKNSKENAGKGLFIYSREAIYPYTDSLFI